MVNGKCSCDQLKQENTKSRVVYSSIDLTPTRKKPSVGCHISQKRKADLMDPRLPTENMQPSPTVSITGTRFPESSSETSDLNSDSHFPEAISIPTPTPGVPFNTLLNREYYLKGLLVPLSFPQARSFFNHSWTCHVVIGCTTARVVSVFQSED